MGRLILPTTELGLPAGLASALATKGVGPSVVRLMGDASTRTYFRVQYESGGSLILMLYPNPGEQEEAGFLEVQGFLESLGLPVPRVLDVYPDRGAVVLEDLGDNLLESAIACGDQHLTRNLYEQAVDVLLRMRRATEGMRSGCGAFTLAFDEQKLMQEMEFFLTHFVHGLCRAKLSPASLGTLRDFFLYMCSILAAEPRIFTHRDYHSRNLILHNERLIMIDFQDARMGPAQYDLASLLRDSYVTLPDDLVQGLLNRYAQETLTEPRDSIERFRYVFDLMSLQRNIKALGTFGYQVSVRGSHRYLSSIPRTGAYIAGNIGKYREFSRFRSAVEDLVSSPALEMCGRP
jgi:N-acetylmuramate 1-kinase